MTLARRPRSRPRYMSFEGGPIDGELYVLGVRQEAPPYYVHRVGNGNMHRYKRRSPAIILVDGKDLLPYVHEGCVSLGPDE